METKHCPKCEETKPLTSFNKAKNRKSGVQTYCRECQKLIDKRFYATHEGHRIKAKARRKNHKTEVRKFLWSLLNRSECKVCGETDPMVLTFDHLQEKKFAIGEGVAKGYSLERITAEIAKCQILCANCHMRKTAKDFGWYKDLIGR